MNPQPHISPRFGDSDFHIMAKWKWHLQTLLRLRDHFRQESQGHIEEAETLGLAGPDFAAQASIETLIAQVRAEKGLLAEVEAALGRMHEGTYGICIVRRTPIPAARLRAIPWTAFCVEAATAHES